MSEQATHPADAAPDDLMREFESLGANCEFGLVQRHFGAEALGLLRWGHVQTGFDGLLHMIASRFEGIGEHVSLQDFNGEWVSRDDRYAVVFHTQRLVGTVDPDRFLISERNRIQFMADSLLSLMQEAQTMFIYKVERAEDAAHIAALRDTLRTLGPAPLLFVTEAPDRAGQIDAAGDGLFTGYIDRFSPVDDVHSYCSFDLWLQLCRTARRMWSPA